MSENKNVKNGTEAQRSAYWKAQKSKVLMSPGEDAAAFQNMRDALFDRYVPCTIDEAWCVDSIAEHTWEIARCRQLQVAFRARATASLDGSSDGAFDKAAAAEGKRWLRTLKESVQMETLLVDMNIRAHKEILRMQKARRQGLIAGTPEGMAAEMVRERQPAKAAAVADVSATVKALDPASDSWAATHSAVNENGNSDKRKAQAKLNELQQRLQPTVGHG